MSETDQQMAYGGFINAAVNSVIENCINYGDFFTVNGGGIVKDAVNCVIRNCKNYGNFSSKYTVGGIVGAASEDILIENCENYGNIAGKCGIGGILGSIYFSSPTAFPQFSNSLDKNKYSYNQVIKNCKNYGNIYLLKEKGDKRIETTGHEGNGKVDYYDVVYMIGGITGCVATVENCDNYGNFYGFENMGKGQKYYRSGKGIRVDKMGGVVGIALEVKNCTNSGSMVIQKGRALDVGDICGYLMG